MPPRSLWSGSLAFGLVNIPIKVTSAIQDKDVRFNLLHDADGGRIQFKRMCSKDGKEVPNDHIVKGYEIGPDQYVTFTDDELSALDPAASRTIDIQDFVEQAEIDPCYFDKPYILVPDKNAGKAYALMLAALASTERVGIARMVWHGKENLVAIRARNGLLMMETMQFADEVVPLQPIVDELALPAPDAKQLKLAEQLIASLEAPFDPSQYPSEQRDRILKAIEEKQAGKEIVLAPAPAVAARTSDLMAALEASLQATAKRRAAPAKQHPPTPKRRRPAA